MQRRRLCAALFAALALSVPITSCGDDSLEQGTTAPPANDSRDSGSVSSPPANPGESPPDRAGQAATITSRNDLTATSPIEPESVTVDPGNDRRLLVRFWGGVEPCFGAQIRAVETTSEVKVTVLGGVPPEGRDRACIALAKSYQAAVDLHGPLGTRTITVTK